MTIRLLFLLTGLVAAGLLGAVAVLVAGAP